MVNDTTRARANDKPPNLNNPKEILEELLQIERDRLDIAVVIERRRNIVFPETSVIIRDIMKIMNALGTKIDIDTSDSDDDIGALLSELG